MDSRIKRLETLVKCYATSQQPAVFLLEDGDTYATSMDPIAYLMTRGAETPKGRIVAYPHKTEDVDALSLSLYELLDEGIQQGGLQNMLKMIEYVK